MEFNDAPFVPGEDPEDIGSGRVTHLYVGSSAYTGNPMCVRGWNRENGASYLILKGIVNRSICRVCLRRAKKGLPAVRSRFRKTRIFGKQEYFNNGPTR